MSDSKNINDELSDFQGFTSVQSLRDNGFDMVPETKGIYLVLYMREEPPIFLEKSGGGRFKQKDPSVSVETLKSKWVPNERIIYIGQAGGNGRRGTLRERLKLYVQFGSGKGVGHKGGRYIWQIKDSNDLLIAWKETKDDPYIEESKLISDFKARHKSRPFANLNK